jgi:hypothetical protein
MIHILAGDLTNKISSHTKNFRKLYRNKNLQKVTRKHELTSGYRNSLISDVTLQDFNYAKNLQEVTRKHEFTSGLKNSLTTDVTPQDLDYVKNLQEVTRKYEYLYKGNLTAFGSQSCISKTHIGSSKQKLCLMILYAWPNNRCRIHII